MNKTNNAGDIEEALKGLLEKYNVRPSVPFNLTGKGSNGNLTLLPGFMFSDSPPEQNQIPLLPWRSRRKFIELKKIIADTVIENPCLFRFCFMENKNEWTLSSVLYREMDLFEFIGNGKIISIQAVFSDNEAGNVILRMDNGAICSIEAGTQIPAGMLPVERHEIIAQRGVASDLVVDSQVPHSSVYCYTREGEKRYTDTDMELYGFTETETDHIRSAFEVLKNPDLITEWKNQHAHLKKLIGLAFESDIKHERIIIK